MTHPCAHNKKKAFCIRDSPIWTICRGIFAVLAMHPERVLYLVHLTNKDWKHCIGTCTVYVWEVPACATQKNKYSLHTARLIVVIRPNSIVSDHLMPFYTLRDISATWYVVASSAVTPMGRPLVLMWIGFNWLVLSAQVEVLGSWKVQARPNACRVAPKAVWTLADNCQCMGFWGSRV